MTKILITLLSTFLLLVPTSIFAQGKDKKGSAGGKREKIISREGSTKKNRDSKKIDFDDTEIDGNRKNPMASMLTNTKAKKEYDMVPIRTEWKPQMYQSASSLDAGRSN
ncbi:MAG: hypothetical protein NT027_18730 [Proteobacteria bacterium]|nr:hypothetical protein [Pseudomonadota bacterium]